jgi:hypothetical protein
MINTLEQETQWQKLKTTDESLEQDAYFTFSGDSQKYPNIR